MQILEDLYLGGIRPTERFFQRNSQYAQALNEIVKAEEALNSSLNEEQRKQYEAFIDAQRELSALTDAETFIYAFRLGAKIIMDVLTDGQMREI